MALSNEIRRFDLGTCTFYVRGPDGEWVLLGQTVPPTRTTPSTGAGRARIEPLVWPKAEAQWKTERRGFKR